MTKLEGGNGYSTAKKDQDSSELLKFIKGLYCYFDSKTQMKIAKVEETKMAVLSFQEFKAQIEAIKSYGGTGTMRYISMLIKALLK